MCARRLYSTSTRSKIRKGFQHPHHTSLEMPLVYKEIPEGFVALPCRMKHEPSHQTNNDTINRTAYPDILLENLNKTDKWLQIQP